MNWQRFWLVYAGALTVALLIGCIIDFSIGLLLASIGSAVMAFGQLTRVVRAARRGDDAPVGGHARDPRAM
jgi:hypothetical protein